MLTQMSANFNIAIFCSQFLAHCVFIEQEHRNQVCYIFFSIVLHCYPLLNADAYMFGLFFSSGDFGKIPINRHVFLCNCSSNILSVVLTQSSFTRKYFRELVESGQKENM